MANQFKGMGNLGGLLKQAQQMQENMVKLQEEMDAARFEAGSGGGLVTAIVTGKGQLESISIKPEAIDPEDIEMLEDLIVTAVRAACEEAETVRAEKMQEATGGMGLPPGLGL
jgi:DNA-binding YbaB/EbfC family protein